MKKPTKLLAALISSMLVLTACGQGANQLQTPSGQSAAQVNSTSKVRINNNSQSLESRMVRKSQTVRIKPDGFTAQHEGPHSGGTGEPISLTLVAEVLPPTVDGKTIQATNVYIKDSTTAYVSYDVAGDEYAGGVYIIDVSDPHHPVLKAEMTLDGTDFYSVTVKDDRLYLPGATEDEGFDSPAMLQSMSLFGGGSAFGDDLGRIDLPSYAATDVAAHMDNIYVSSGDVGGGITHLKADLSKAGFYPMFDARSVNMGYYDAVNDTAMLAVFKGQPGEVQLLGPDLTHVRTIDLPDSANIPVSQSILDVEDNIAMIGAGNGGTIAVDLAAGTVLDSMVPEHGITNGTSIGDVPGVRENLVFMAEGEDGVGVAEMIDGELHRLGSLDFEASYSSNMVRNDCCVVFVANGLGGLSILVMDDCENHHGPGPSPSPSVSVSPTPEPTPMPSNTPEPTPMPSATPPDGDDDDCELDFERDWEKLKIIIKFGYKGQGDINWDILKTKFKIMLKGKTRIDVSDIFDCVDGELSIDWKKLKEKHQEMVCDLNK
ncbi:MAG: hypothetical protein CVV27_08865 [Candidatus Melainabacteria bacterium HGW-Melainabacteria-1]|nr:MAG: hypothetical protein CVV27_08865 [Candidatus Melainabacteria bacterium HGW-Melainabacteria-1]